MEGRVSDSIVKTLTLMCDKDNPQDKKLLLLAELVESKFDTLAQRQDRLQASLNNTNEKLDKVTELLEQQQDFENHCPVYKNKKGFEMLSFLFSYPRLCFFIVIGAAAIIAGFFGSNIVSALRLIFGI